MQDSVPVGSHRCRAGQFGAHVAAACLLVLGSLGCSGSGSDVVEVGGEGSSCSAGQPCGAGFECVAGKCVATSPGEDVRTGNDSVSTDQLCLPTCDGRKCGDNGCGGSCGECADNAICLQGTCLCEHETCGNVCCDVREVCVEGECCKPSCEDLICGDDGCGGSCGECAEGEECQEGDCVPTGCIPECEGKQCGDDGCEGDCGTCGCGENCEAGICVYHGCEGLECGPDGCGSDCGECSDTQVCSDGACICEFLTCGTECCLENQVCAGDECCTPDCGGKDCGSDGCAGSCGQCNEWPSSYCTEAGVCDCAPECEGKQCGNDQCGGVCGECGCGHECEGGLCTFHGCDDKACGPDGCGGTCGECGCGEQCQDSDCLFVACEGKECGPDGCGGDCGDCPGPQDVCDAGVCTCEPSCENLECGDDGCGGDCGTCIEGLTCIDGDCLHPDPHVIRYWSFNDGAGDTATDFTGSGNDGAIVGATPVLGKVGMALEFDGDDHVDCGDEIDLSVFAGATIALWVRTGTDLNSEQRIFAKHNNYYGNGYWIDVAAGSFRARVYIEGQSSDTLTAPVSPNEWFHLALVHDGQVTRLYVNGALEDEAPAQGPIHENDHTLFLGSSKNKSGVPEHFFTGLIDEVTIYDIALPGPDIQAAYESGS